MKEKKITMTRLMAFLLVLFTVQVHAQFFEMDAGQINNQSEKFHYEHNPNDPFNDPEVVKEFLQRFQRTPDKIVGGEDVDILDYPWQISLQLQPQFGGSHFCGGTIIDDEWILTASHCLVFEDQNGDDLFLQPMHIRIRAGFTALSSGEGNYYNIQDIILHPDYSSAGHEFDIALLRLNSPIDFDHPGKRKVGLIRNSDVENGLTDPGIMAKVSGWGALSSGGPSPDILQAVEVPIVGGTANYPPGYITPDMLLAGEAGKDACQGDSGGPLVVDDGHGWYKVAGVVSWGVGCGMAGYPGVYARVSYFENWLDQYLVFPDPNQFVTLHHEDFSGGDLPAGWVNEVISGPAGFPGWEWTLTGGDYGGQLNSTTADNGYMILDSDAHGAAGADEEADMITEAFDLSDVNGSIYMSVEHLARTYGSAEVSIYVSNDDFATATQLYHWANAEQHEANGPNPVVSVFDITDVAQGQSDVKFKFKWVGSWDYWWLVDDLKILLENPPLEVEFVVTDGENPLSEALVSTAYTGQQATTNEEGIALLTLFEGTYDISVTRSGYEPFSTTIDVTEDGQVVNVEMIKIPAPEIEIEVEEIEFSLAQGSVGSTMLNIANPGDAELQFALFAYPMMKGQKNAQTHEISTYPETGNFPLEELQADSRIKDAFYPNKGEKVDEEVELHHDNGYAGNGIGAGANTWISAVRFDADDVAPYVGLYDISQIKFHIRDTGFNEVVVKIWEGGSEMGAGTEIYSQVVTDDVVIDEWNIHQLPETIMLQPGTEYWFGYSITSTGAFFPASTDNGPMEPEKGGWIFFNGSWALLPDLNADLDYNWCIRGVLQLSEQIDWLSFNPQSGTVAPESDLDVELIFDATELELGQYTAQIVVQNNVGESINLPVEFNVVEAESDVTFVVTDEYGVEIDDATVSLDGVTNEPGDYFFEGLPIGNYAYEVTKEGYYTAQGSILVDEDMTVEVTLINQDSEITVDLSVSIVDEFDQPVENAYFQLQGYGSHFTDENGTIEILVVPGQFIYSVSKTGFVPQSDEFEIPDTGENTFTLNIEMEYLRFDVTVDVNIDGAGTVTGAGEYYYGQMATIEAEAAEAYHFLHWVENGNMAAETAQYEFAVTKDMDFLAVFAINTYTITASSSPNGSIDPEGEIEVEHGEDFTFNIAAMPGYHIFDVLVDGVTVGAVESYTFEDVKADGSIHAVFEINTYEVEITSEGNGTITPDGTHTVSHGDDMTFTLTPDVDHRIADLLVNGQSVYDDVADGVYLLINISGHTTVHAEFEYATGITQVAADALKLYPNPATSAVTVSSQNMMQEIRILTLQGQLVESVTVYDTQHTFSVEGYKTGIYLIQVVGAEGVQSVPLKVQ